MSRYPVVDRPPLWEDVEFRRHIVQAFGDAEPYIAEMDWWASMPVRLVHNTAVGWALEVGPYELWSGEIELLREAIAAYDLASEADR